MGNMRSNSTATPLGSGMDQVRTSGPTFWCFFDTASSKFLIVSSKRYWSVRLDRLPSTLIQRCVWTAVEIRLDLNKNRSGVIWPVRLDRLFRKP